MKVFFFPFSFVCFHFLFVVCLSLLVKLNLIYVFSFNLALLLQSNKQYYFKLEI